MGFILGAILLAYFAAIAARALSNANPDRLKQWFGRGLGLAVLAAAAATGLHGQIIGAIVLGLAGFWLLGRGVSLASFRVGSFASKRTGISRMRSAMIEMEMDHTSNKLDGLVLAGPFEGKALADLSRSQCLQLHATCLYHDAGGARLLEAYFNRRFPGWRQAGKGETDSRRSGEVRSRAGAMSFDEAYEVLGLRQGAGREDIVRAHRTLMKKWHPDHGGSTDLAARVNEAKEVLMRRHL